MARVLMVLPMALGMVAVVQAVLNRRIAGQLGLSAAVLLNSIVLCVAALAAFGLARPTLSPFESASAFRWWFFVPGLCGFALVTGLPYAVERVGATATFVGLIGAQVATSVAWDFLFEGRPLSWVRVAGAALAFAGAALTTWAR